MLKKIVGAFGAMAPDIMALCKWDTLGVFWVSAKGTRRNKLIFLAFGWVGGWVGGWMGSNSPPPPLPPSKWGWDHFGSLGVPRNWVGGSRTPPPPFMAPSCCCGLCCSAARHNNELRCSDDHMPVTRGLCELSIRCFMAPSVDKHMPGPWAGVVQLKGWIRTPPLSFPTPCRSPGGGGGGVTRSTQNCSLRLIVLLCGWLCCGALPLVSLTRMAGHFAYFR